MSRTENSRVAGLKCYYCGDPAHNKDHVLPKAWRGPRKQRQKLRREAMEQLGRNTVPACKDCNTLKGDLTPQQFRAELERCRPVSFYHQIRDMKLHRLAKGLFTFGMSFYGERSPDGKFPEVGAQPFKYRWKMKAPRNTGNEAVRIEESAKRGKYGETLAGLMNGT